MARRRSTVSLLTHRAFQFPIALIIIGITCILASLYISNSNASDATNIKACLAYPVQNINTAKPGPGQVAFTFNSQGQGGRVSASVKSGSACAGKLVSLVSFQSPSANGQPLSKQSLFSSKTVTTSTSPVALQASIPSCFYQLDLVYGHAPAAQPTFERDKIIWFRLGGNNSCAATTSPTPTPTTTPAPGGGEVDVSNPPGPNETEGGSDQASTLPDTGDTNLTLFGIALTLIGLIMAWYQRRKLLATKR